MHEYYVDDVYHDYRNSDDDEYYNNYDITMVSKVSSWS